VGETLCPGGNGAALIVRPVRCEERARWRQLMDAHHYLGFRPRVGQALWYVATLEEQWVGLLGWAAAALQCGPRDTWIGWTPRLKFRRLHLIANHVRFLILPEGHRPNFASQILALNLRRLSADWESYYGHPLLLVETFVDEARFRGTCYRAAGWQALGLTRGFAKHHRGYVAHGHPKQVWVRPLQPRGVRHPLVTVVAIAVGAALAGARTFNAVAEWAQDLPRAALRRFGSRRWTAPSEPTLRRVLQKLDADRLDTEIGSWLLRQCALQGRGLSVDGQTLRGAHDAGQAAPQLLSAILHPEGIVVAQGAVGEKTNEIPELPRLLAPLPLAGAVVRADALHTPKDTARYLVEKKHADYVFTVKDHPPTLQQDIADLHLDAFPPSTHHHG
jgi:hypothetical protein